MVHYHHDNEKVDGDQIKMQEGIFEDEPNIMKAGFAFINILIREDNEELKENNNNCMSASNCFHHQIN